MRTLFNIITLMGISCIGQMAFASFDVHLYTQLNLLNETSHTISMYYYSKAQNNTHTGTLSVAPNGGHTNHALELYTTSHPADHSHQDETLCLDTNIQGTNYYSSSLTKFSYYTNTGGLSGAFTYFKGAHMYSFTGPPSPTSPVSACYTQNSFNSVPLPTIGAVVPNYGEPYTTGTSSIMGNPGDSGAISTGSNGTDSTNPLVLGEGFYYAKSSAYPASGYTKVTMTNIVQNGGGAHHAYLNTWEYYFCTNPQGLSKKACPFVSVNN